MTDLLLAKASAAPLILILILGAFVFLIVLPNRRRQRAAREQLSSLEPGQEVLTVGGLIGRIVEVGDQDLKLELAEGIVVRLARRGVATVLAPEEEEDLVEDEAEPVDEAVDGPLEPDAETERPEDPR